VRPEVAESDRRRRLPSTTAFALLMVSVIVVLAMSL
jgi:hypothetical protein